MAAIACPLIDPWADRRPSGACRPERTDQPDARRYRRDARRYGPGATVYRRRRAVAFVVLVAVAVVAVTGIRLALAGAGGGALTASGSARAGGGAAAGPSSSGHIYVVQPGDSVWSIVEATSRGGDPRPEVDRLTAALGGQPLQPGERLQLP